MGDLTPRQRRFCEAYAADPCGERAAIAAGYQAKSARVQGSKLLTKPNILEYIRELQAPPTRERILTATEIKKFWSRIIMDESQRMTDRLQASTLLAKSGGLFRTTVDMGIHKDNGGTKIYLPIRPGIDKPGQHGNIVLYDPDSESMTCEND